MNEADNKPELSFGPNLEELQKRSREINLEYERLEGEYKELFAQCLKSDKTEQARESELAQLKVLAEKIIILIQTRSEADRQLLEATARAELLSRVDPDPKKLN